jgi:hypothetical protein
MRVLLVAALLVVVPGCANPPIVPVNDGSYFVAKEDHAGNFGSMAKLKSDVISKASRFAARKGRVAVPLSVREKAVGSKPGEWINFEYQLKLADAASNEMRSLNANRHIIGPRDVATDATNRISMHI